MEPAGALEPEEPAEPEPVEHEPAWISDLLALWKREILEFVRTAIALLVRPRRFGDEWSRGQFHAMSPIAFVLASATVLLPADYGLQRVLQWDTRPDVSIGVDIARAAKPFVLAILTGLATHGVLHLFGSRRKASTTIGMIIYGTAVAWALWCLGLVVSAITGLGGTVPNVLSACSGLWLALALDGVHRIQWWWCAAATIITGFPILVVVNLSLAALGLT